MTKQMKVLLGCLALLALLTVACSLDIDRDEWPAGQEAAQRIQATEEYRAQRQMEATMTAEAGK